MQNIRQTRADVFFAFAEDYFLIALTIRPMYMV